MSGGPTLTGSLQRSHFEFIVYVITHSAANTPCPWRCVCRVNPVKIKKRREQMFERKKKENSDQIPQKEKHIELSCNSAV